MRSWREAIKAENDRLGIRELPPARAQASAAVIEPVSVFKEPRQRHQTGEMNGLEKRYAAHLDIRKAVGEIRGWKFEAIKLRLAPSTFYNVDFTVWMADGSFEQHEVKGTHFEDDARVKVKVAARMFPEYKFVVVREKDRQRGEWKYEELPA